MKSCLQPFLLSVGLVCLLGVGPARAADPDTAALATMVSVQTVNFGSAQAPGGGAWGEVDVELSIKPVGSRQWADRVKVTLAIAYSVDEGGKTSVKSYRATAEAVSLEAGGSPHFRFYLPPEVIKEYKLKDTADYYGIEITVGGVKLPPTKKNASSKLDTPDKLSHLLASGTENNGILLPQSLSPFAHDTNKSAPSFVRAEGAAGGAAASAE